MRTNRHLHLLPNLQQTGIQTQILAHKRIRRDIKLGAQQSKRIARGNLHAFGRILRLRHARPCPRRFAAALVVGLAHVGRHRERLADGEEIRVIGDAAGDGDVAHAAVELGRDALERVAGLDRVVGGGPVGARALLPGVEGACGGAAAEGPGGDAEDVPGAGGHAAEEGVVPVEIDGAELAVALGQGGVGVDPAAWAVDGGGDCGHEAEKTDRNERGIHVVGTQML